ncbi:hypothetical protein WJX64_09795 [Leifsonia sp. YIM 134122]|uniref:DUF1707 domain-containing protein n=1 Tax=Leifsonia stereocauli TaxID=3134136 RepID=A0ABU9W597_9MICO
MQPAEREERIRHLQRSLYSADAVTDAARDDALDELRGLEAEQAAVDTAPTTDAARGPAPETAASDTVVAGHPARDSGRRGIVLAAVGAAAALVIGVVIGVTSSGTITGVVSGVLGGAPAPEPSAAAIAFARPQAPVDIPDIPLGDRFVASSFRQLLEAGLDTLYLARDVDDDICLIVVIQTQDFAATCTPERDLDASGLQLRWQSMTPYRDLPGQPNVSDFEFTWHPDGTSSMEASN